MEFITYIAKSAGILTLFYLVYIFVLRKDTFFTANRTFLLVGIASALLLPFVTFTSITFVEAPVFIASEDFVEIVPTLKTQATPTKETIAVWQLLLGVYFIGLSIMAVRFGIQLASLLNLLRKHPSTVVNGFRFIEIDDEIAPFSFFSYIVFNPETHEQQELEMILQHEKVHAAQWHSVDLLLATIIRALQWINPISWGYKKSIEANLEFLADFQTASSVPSKTEYQLALLKASLPLPVPALTNNFYHSFIKKRIIMLNKSNSNKYNQLKLMLVLPALAVFLWSFNTEEVIEYTTSIAEISSEENNAIIKSKVLSFSAETTDSELDALENHFTENHPESLVKIANRKRNAGGSLINFSFQTKFIGNDMFYTRFDRGAGAPFQTVYTIEAKEKGALLVSEIGKDGMQIKITKEQLELFSTEEKALDLKTKRIQEKDSLKLKEPMLGKNPLYIINGKEYRKDQLPADKTIELDGYVEVFNKQEGREKYGVKGKDGVMLFHGVATFTKAKEETSENNNFRFAKKGTAVSTKEIRIKITKNTTKEELDGFKKELKELHNINFNYSDVDFNNRKEITAITVRYDGHGNTGTYAVGSDDGSPIEDFHFFMDTDEGTSGFGTASNPRINAERLAMLEERKQLMKNRLENMSEVRSNLAETRSELLSSQANLRAEQAEMRKTQANLQKEATEIRMLNGQVAKTSYKLNTKINGKVSNKIVITKNTTDAHLMDMRFKLAERGVDFNFKRIKRNSAGEITSIKATFDNGKGSKISKSIQSDDDEAIDMIVVDM